MARTFLPESLEQYLFEGAFKTFRSQPNEASMKLTIAWTSDNPASSSRQSIRLFKSTWENPYSAMRMRQLDFISDEESAGAPFLVAVTAEP